MGFGKLCVLFVLYLRKQKSNGYDNREKGRAKNIAYGS